MHYSVKQQPYKRTFNASPFSGEFNKRQRIQNNSGASHYAQTQNGFPVLKRSHFLTLFDHGNMQAPKAKSGARGVRDKRSREDKRLNQNSLLEGEVGLPVDRLLHKAGDICFSPHNGRGDNTAVITNFAAYEELYALMKTFKQEAMNDINQKVTNETKQKNGVDRFERLKECVDRHENLQQQAVIQQQEMMMYSQLPPMNMDSLNFNFTGNTAQHAKPEPFIFGQQYTPIIDTGHQDLFTPAPTTKAYSFPQLTTTMAEPSPFTSSEMMMPAPSLISSYTMPQALTEQSFSTTSSNYHLADPLNDPFKSLSSGISSYNSHGMPPASNQTEFSVLDRQEIDIQSQISSLYQSLEAIKQKKQNLTPPPENNNSQLQTPDFSQLFRTNSLL